MTFQNKMNGISQIWRTLIMLNILKVKAATWFKPIQEDERPATPEPEWTIPPNDFLNQRKTGQMHTPHRIKFPRRTSFKGRRMILVHSSNGSVDEHGKKSSAKLIWKVQRSTFDKDEKLPIYNPAKAARYLDFGLEELVPSLWVESERDYDISAAYGITHWWFRRKQFYINQHSEPSDREAVRSQMQILSVIRVKTFEKYGYNYLREIILRRADYKEYKISEKDFKNLHPNDFEDLYLLNIQDKLNHLSKSDKIHLHTAVNMWIRNLVIRNRDRNDQRKLMRLNEIHKFSDGTLTRVMEKLDHMVKDFHLFEYNKGMETRTSSEDDKRRSKDFIIAIEKRLQIQEIFSKSGSLDGEELRGYLTTVRTVPKDYMHLLYWSIGVIRLVRLEHPSETKVLHNEDGNPARANIKQALGSYERPHKGVKASANSDIVYFFTSAQDGDPLQDDVRLCLGDDLKKAQDHNQRQVKDESKDHYPKCTDDEDAHEHVRRVLEIVDLFHFPGVTHDADLLEKEFIWQYCSPFKTAKKLKEIRNFKQEMCETLYQAWERYNDLLFKCPQLNLNNHQKVQIFYTGLDISTRRMLDSRGFIPLMTPTQECPLEKEDKTVEQREKLKARTTIGKENMNEPVPRDLPPTPFLGHLKEQIGSPYQCCKYRPWWTNPEKVNKMKAWKDEGDIDVDWDITVEDVERLRQFLTPTIHTLPNLKPVVQPYMSLGPVHDKEKIVREEEHYYDIPLHDGVMQPLTP
ncbi:hypothetical protein Tco_1524074 [Tanacetum coccineum]